MKKKNKKHFILPVTIQDTPIRELIRRRRRQIAVHSIIYYRYGRNIVSDSTFDKWCNELIQLQKDYPKISKHIELHKDFENLKHASGFDLKCLNDPKLISVAERLLRLEDEKLKNNKKSFK